MGGFTASFEGLRELDAKLSALKGPAARQLIREAVLAGGKVLQTEVRLRAPERVSTGHGNALPPGVLKNDIELHFGITEEGLPAAIVKPGKYTAHVARWVEYGHRLVRGGYSKLLPGGRSTRGRGQEVGAVQPYPFIRPAFETARAPAVQATVESLRHNLPDAIQKGTISGAESEGEGLTSGEEE
jgi:hypothetical protein